MPNITCPECKASFELTDALAGPLLASAKQETALAVAAAEKKAERERAAAVAEVERKARDEASAIEKNAREVAKAEAEASAVIKIKEAREAAEVSRATVQTLRAKVEEAAYAERALQEKLSAAQAAQAESLRKERSLEDARRELDLTIERRVNESLGEIRTKAQIDAETAIGLQVAERQNTIDALKKQLDEMRAKAAQGDQRLQGEVQELALEAMLRDRFPADTVEPVAKGVHGGDILLRVSGTNGQPAGAILFESKRTKTWDQKWLAKLRDDARTAKADLAVIVSATLPKDVASFELIEGVWVTGVPTAMALTSALRCVLQEAAAARTAGEGLATKAELVYRYLTGPSFRHRLTAAVEAFNTLQKELEKEKRAMQRQWAVRVETHDKAIGALVGLHGDLSGIAGSTLPQLEGDIFAAALPEASGG